MATTNFIDGQTVIEASWLNDVDDVVYGTPGAILASNVTNTPAGTIAATNVQTALNELDTEKAAASHVHSAADITSGTHPITRGGTDGTTQATALAALGAALNGTLAKTAAYTVVTGDRGKLIDCTPTANMDLTLPAVSDGFVVGVRNSSASYTVTVKAADTIDGIAGATGVTFGPGESGLIVGGTAWKTVGKNSSGSVMQTVYFSTGAVASGSTAIPWDDTIPQNTEGDQFMELLITPTSSTNYLEIEIVAFLHNNSGGNYTVIGALFQDSTAGALAGSATSDPNTLGGLLVLKHRMLTGTISATTFKFRAGTNVAGVTMNGDTGARKLGGVMASSITIREVRP